jgi:aspartyl aminopeptidase
VSLELTLALVDRNVNDSFKFNQETEFVPILGLLEAKLNGLPADLGDGKDPATTPKASSIQNNHHSSLLSLFATELSVSPNVIHDFEVYVT